MVFDKSFAWIIVGAIPSMSVLGCSDGGGSNDGVEGSDSGSSSGPDDPQSTGEHSTGAESTGDESSGDESSGDESSGNESTGEDPQVEPALECAATTSTLAGDIDGVSLDGTYGTGFILWPTGSGATAVFQGEDTIAPGIVQLQFERTIDLYTTDPQSTHGYVRPPTDTADGGPFYCFDRTSTYLSSGEMVQGDVASGTIGAVFNGVAELGSCPGGTPIEGSVTLCYGDESCGGAVEYRSDLEGASFSIPVGVAGFGETTAEGVHRAVEFIDEADGAFPNGGTLEFVSEIVDPSGEHTSPVSAGYLTIPLGHPDGGAIYCAQSGSFTYRDAFAVSVELTGLSRLGSCTEVSGDDTVEFCLNTTPVLPP